MPDSYRARPDPTAQLAAIEGRQRHCLAKAPLAGILRTLLGTDVPALASEVRSLRARIAAADQLHRPTEWHLYATRDCPYEECDPGDEEHQPSGCCIAATYKVCAECVDNCREGMGDWLDVTDVTPPGDILWPCTTHRALHPDDHI